mgnify:CR=1 FL=1
MPHRSAAQMYRAARKSDALLTGAPLPTLFYFALPIILGNIFQQLYSLSLIHISEPTRPY